MRVDHNKPENVNRAFKNGGPARNRKQIRKAIRDEKKERKRLYATNAHKQIEQSKERHEKLREKQYRKTDRYKTYDHHQAREEEEAPEAETDIPVLDFDALTEKFANDRADRRMKRVDKDIEDSEALKNRKRGRSEEATVEPAAAEQKETFPEDAEIAYYEKMLGKKPRNLAKDGLDYLAKVVGYDPDGDSNDSADEDDSKSKKKDKKKDKKRKELDSDEDQYDEEDPKNSDASEAIEGDNSAGLDSDEDDPFGFNANLEDESDDDGMTRDSEDGDDDDDDGDDDEDDDELLDEDSGDSDSSDGAGQDSESSSVSGSNDDNNEHSDESDVEDDEGGDSKEKSSSASANAAVTKQFRAVFNRMTVLNFLTFCVPTLELLFSTLGHKTSIAALVPCVVDPLAFNNRLLPRFLHTHALGIYYVARLHSPAFDIYAGLWSKLQDMLRSPEVNREALLNLTSVIALLYYFDSISTQALQNLIVALLNCPHAEVRAELLTRVAEYCGSRLKKSDPSAFRVVLDTLKKAGSSEGNESRTRFMIDEFERVSTAPSIWDQETYSKFAADVLQATKSKAKPGQPTVHMDLDRPSGSGTDHGGKQENKKKAVQIRDADDERIKQVREIALRDRVISSSELRKAIFFIMQLSADLQDMVLKLREFAAKHKDGDRDIMRMVVHCVQKERSYNPFYLQLTRALLSDSRAKTQKKFEYSLQYALWDAFRKPRNPVALALYVSHLMQSHVYGSASLLRAVEYQALDANSRLFLSVFLTSLLRSVATAGSILHDEGAFCKYGTLRDGMLFFVQAYCKSVDEDVLKVAKLPGDKTLVTAKQVSQRMQEFVSFLQQCVVEETDGTGKEARGKSDGGGKRKGVTKEDWSDVSDVDDVNLDEL